MSIVNPGRNLILHQGNFHAHHPVCIAGNIFRQRHADSLHRTAPQPAGGTDSIDRCTAVYRCRMINNAGFACLHINLKLNRTCHKRRRGNGRFSTPVTPAEFHARTWTPLRYQLSDLLRLIPGFSGCEYLFSVKFHCIRRTPRSSAPSLQICSRRRTRRTPFGRFRSDRS